MPHSSCSQRMKPRMNNATKLLHFFDINSVRQNKKQKNPPHSLIRKQGGYANKF